MKTRVQTDARSVETQERDVPSPDDDDVLIEGPGPIGVLTAAVVDSLGANVLVTGLTQDTDYRLPLLEDMGISTINAEEESLTQHTDAFTNGRGFDVIFDTTGHKSGIEMAAGSVRKGSQIVVVGLPGNESEVFVTPLVRGEVNINTSYGSTWRNFEQALRLMERRTIAIDDIVDDSFSVSDPDAAFDAFLASATCKPVFNFTE